MRQEAGASDLRVEPVGPAVVAIEGGVLEDAKAGVGWVTRNGRITRYGRVTIYGWFTRHFKG